MHLHLYDAKSEQFFQADCSCCQYSFLIIFKMKWETIDSYYSSTIFPDNWTLNITLLRYSHTKSLMRLICFQFSFHQFYDRASRKHLYSAPRFKFYDPDLCQYTWRVAHEKTQIVKGQRGANPMSVGIYSIWKHKNVSVII